MTLMRVCALLCVLRCPAAQPSTPAVPDYEDQTDWLTGFVPGTIDGSPVTPPCKIFPAENQRLDDPITTAPVQTNAATALPNQDNTTTALPVQTNTTTTVPVQTNTTTALPVQTNTTTTVPVQTNTTTTVPVQTNTTTTMPAQTNTTTTVKPPVIQNRPNPVLTFYQLWLTNHLANGFAPGPPRILPWPPHRGPFHRPQTRPFHNPAWRRFPPHPQGAPGFIHRRRRWPASSEED